jgi:hypothetical protein
MSAVTNNADSVDHSRFAVIDDVVLHHCKSMYIADSSNRSDGDCRRGKRNRISLKRKATDDHMQTTANERAIRVDETIVGEILALRTIADVFWMDGCTEKGVSTTQLEYADLDLDQHDVIPGSIVSLKSDGNNSMMNLFSGCYKWL